MRLWFTWLLGGLALLVLSYMFCTHQPASPSDWAGWAQAFGSIVAIIAAFVVPSIQFDHELRRKREADAESLRSLLVLTEQIVSHIDAFSADLRNITDPVRLGKSARNHLQKAASCINGIARMSLGQFPMSAIATVALAEMHAQFGDHSHGVVNGINDPTNDDFDGERQTLRDHLVEHMNDLGAEVERIAAGRPPVD